MARIQTRRPAVAATNNHKQPMTVQDAITLADWYLELGKAHRLDAMGDSTMIDWDQMDIQACIEAFQQAVTHYHQALDDHHPTNEKAVEAPLTTRLSLAWAESFLAESLVASFQTKMALQHFEHAVENYKLVLERKTLSPQDEMDWEILYANTMGHAATLLLVEDK